MNWKPIETAPKSRLIIVWNGQDVGEAFFWERNEHEKSLGYPEAWYWSERSCSYCCDEPADPQPTHWMELPIPPQS